MVKEKDAKEETCVHKQNQSQNEFQWTCPIQFIGLKVKNLPLQEKVYPPKYMHRYMFAVLFPSLHQFL